jgi:hypothetical protein
MKKQAINESIHRGFRSWLLELGIRTTKTDFARIEEGRKTVAKLQDLISAWERKFTLESELFFPALALKAPHSVALLDEEKRIVESKCKQVSRIIQQYLQPGLPLHYVSTGKALLEVFSSLSGLLFSYMKHQDGLFRAAADASAGSDWGWGDVDAMLLPSLENQLRTGIYLIDEDFMDVWNDAAETRESWEVHRIKEVKTGPFHFAEIPSRNAVSRT